MIKMGLPLVTLLFLVMFAPTWAFLRREEILAKFRDRNSECGRPKLRPAWLVKELIGPDCQNDPSVEHGSIGNRRCNKFHQPTMDLRCDPGCFLPDGKTFRSITCTRKKSWESKEDCICCTAPSIDNSTISPDGPYGYQHEINVTCDPGHVLDSDVTTSSYTTECQINGTWSRNESCIPISCTAPAVDDSTISPGGPYSYQNEINITCDTGYLLDSDVTTSSYSTECQADGTWSRNDTCIRACIGIIQRNTTLAEGKLPNIGLFTTVTVNCQSEMSPVPFYNTTCTADYTWDKSDLCVPKGDCKALLDAGHTTSGVYNIMLDDDRIIPVPCDQELDGGGWTVFQARVDGSVDFYIYWNDYKDGFGDLIGNFWLGNDALAQLTKDHDQVLKIELEDDVKGIIYAEYLDFWVNDESDKYRLNLGDYLSGDPPGDAMLEQAAGQQFSTRDEDNDEFSVEHCAQAYKGGWWYRYCQLANLNGIYGIDSMESVRWATWIRNKSLKSCRMMMRKRL